MRGECSRGVLDGGDAGLSWFWSGLQTLVLPWWVSCRVWNGCVGWAGLVWTPCWVLRKQPACAPWVGVGVVGSVAILLLSHRRRPGWGLLWWILLVGVWCVGGVVGVVVG